MRYFLFLLVCSQEARKVYQQACVLLATENESESAEQARLYLIDSEFQEESVNCCSYVRDIKLKAVTFHSMHLRVRMNKIT